MKTVQAVQAEAAAYDGEQEQPLGGYAALMGVYLTGVAAAGAVARATGRGLPEPRPWDVLLAGAATHQLSRIVAKDAVTSPVRAPFMRFRGPSGPSELAEEVRGRGARKAVGEMISCPFCVGMWISTGMTLGSVFAPRATR